LCYCVLSWTCVPAQQLRKIYLNPKNTAVQKQSNFIDSIQFIPLEPVNGVNVEAGNVKFTGKYYLVTDYRSGVLYIYAKTGAFIKRIDFNELGDLAPMYRSGSNQLVFFGDNHNYTLTSKDRVKILLDWSNERNLKYFRKYVIDLGDTSFAIKRSRPDKYDLTGAEPLDAEHYLQTKISTSHLYPDSVGYEVNIYKNGKLDRSYFPYDRISEPRFLFMDEQIVTSASDTPSVSYLARPYCDTIYKLVKDSLYPSCQLVLPLENSLPSSFFTTAFRARTEKENFRRNNGWLFYQAHSFYETRKFIYVGIGFFSRFEAFVYDKQTNTTYNVTKIKADPSQYNLALLSSNFWRSGNRFYKLLKAETLVSFFKQNPEIPVPKELATFLQNNPDKNTPVVVTYTLKN